MNKRIKIDRIGGTIVKKTRYFIVDPTESTTGVLDKTRFPVNDYTTTTSANSVTVVEARPLEEPIILANFKLIDGNWIKVH